MLNYSDLKIGEEINFGASSHVYSGKYKGLGVAIKLYNKKHQKELLHKIYGVWNKCYLEYINLLGARSRCLELNNYLQEPIGISKNPSGLDVLVTKLILDDNNQVSSELKNSKKFIDKEFKYQLEKILYLLGEREIYHMHLEDERNILVQVNSGIHPVIIDFQSINEQYYPWLKLTKHLGIDSAKERYFRRVKRLLQSLE